jgi:hypothetical protein
MEGCYNCDEAGFPKPLKMKSRHPRTESWPALVLLLICVSVNLAQVKTPAGLEWREFKSEAGGFTVRFPGTPVVGTAETNKGPLHLTRYTHSLSLSPDLSLELDYMDTPAGGDADISLEGGISGLINSLAAGGATLLTRETITRGSCEGRDATLALPNAPGSKPGFGEGRIFSSGQRFYFMVFISKHDTPEMREVARDFVESFTITGGCTSAVAPVEAPAEAPTTENLEGLEDPATGWRRIESDELGFKVLMPANVRHDTDQPQVKPFPLTHHTYVYSQGGNVYSVEVFGEYPPNFHGTQVSLQTTIDLTLYGLRKNLGPSGFVIDPLRNLRVGTYPGREFSVVSDKLGVRGRAQVYATPKHIYVFLAFVHEQGVSTKFLERFFASVRVSPK